MVDTHDSTGSQDDQDKKCVIFSRDDIIIYYDKEYKVRVKSKGTCTNDIIKANEVVMQINNLPMSKKMRKSYFKEISNIYQIAYNSGIEEAEQYGKKLMTVIENNIIVYKKIEFFIPGFIFALVSISMSALIYNQNLLYIDAFIYGPLGGLLAIIINQKDLNIDYKVERYALVTESLKRIIVSIVVSIIGIIAIKSKLIFANINFDENIYTQYIVLILCGYSQTLIPNLLNKFNMDMENNKS